MRIDGGVAVPRKVFCSCDHTCVLRASSERGGESRDVRRVFSIRAPVDTRVRGVVVDVDYGREDLVYTECACFACGDLALLLRVFRVTRLTDSHVPGKVDGIVKAHARAGFEIGGDQQWITRKLLHAIDQNYRLVNRTTKKNDAADFVVFDMVLECAVGVRVLVEKSRVHANRDQLPDLLLERHLAKLLVGPLQRLR